MTRGPDRPGLRLLGSLFAEERVGRPGPAREQALAAAQADPANAHVHLLDAAYASLVAGEARAADRLLAECEATAPPDRKTKRRIAAARTWSWTVDRAWYPGDVVAEPKSFDIPTFPNERRGDRETRLVEAISEEAYKLRVIRTRIEQLRESLEDALTNAHAWQKGRLEEALERFEGRASALIVTLAFADLLERAGNVEAASAALDRVREHYALAGASRVVGRACTFLVEGDWYAMPGSSPEALGFDLFVYDAPSPFGGRRDVARAASAYDRAAELLVGVDEPRALGALALRRAALAWLSGDHAAQQELIAEAADAFGAAGDSAALRLTTAHALLADIARGRIAATRRDAGTGFDLVPRGPIADVLRWGQHEGSVGWTTGLGRLFQRAAARWVADGDYERAAVAYELAIPLVPASGAESPETVVLDLATLDRDNGFGLRALTRGRSAVATLPRVENATEQPLEWCRSVYCLHVVVVGQIVATVTAAGMSVAALEWATERLRQLLARPGVPPPGSEQTEPFPLAMLPGCADLARDAIAWADTNASFQRGEQAAGIGATATADRWYDEALAKAAALTGLSAMEPVSILAARDRFDAAQARLRELLDDPEQDRDLLAARAVAARDYETALRLFGTEAGPGRSWSQVATHAEAALGAGRIELALMLIDTAVRDFEAQFARLRRDVDRVSASDDVNVADLYLVAARAQLARAEQLDSGGPAAKARAFELSDRARALALAALLADASDHTDDERLILEWRRTTAEWQAAYERLNRGYVTAAADDEITARVADLTSAEHALVEVEAELESEHRGAPGRVARLELPSLADIQEALPHDAALLEYQLVRRDLIVWAITRTTADATTSRHPRGEIARLARAVQRACANGRPGPEANEIAAILVEPAARVIAACRRLIVVPYGPLHGLPFQVLPLGGRALGQTHVLSYLPAAALLHGLRVDEPLAVQRALVVGDPAFDADAHPALPRLPGAVVEAGTIAGTHGTSALIGPDAAEPAIRRELAVCDLVHLAAHGRLDPVAPSDSSIVLAGRDELTVSDLVGLQIGAELAVLSACDSGRGAASLGGDVVGLARGLIAAGARRSVVSLWPVDDAPACVTMSLFHERLVDGRPVAEALQSAQNDLCAMSGSDIAARYVELGGEADASATTRRRGAPSADEPPELPDDPEFVDDLDDSDPVEGLSGELARVWAPFVVIGV